MVLHIKMNYIDENFDPCYILFVLERFTVSENEYGEKMFWLVFVEY